MFYNILNFIKVLFWPIIFMVGQLFLLVLFMLLFLAQNPSVNLNDEVTSQLLFKYINQNTLLIAILQCIVFIPIFYSIYKKYLVDKVGCSIKSMISIALISFLLSSILNFIIIVIKHCMSIDISSSGITFTIIAVTGIIGPILEELLFRGIVYGKLLHIFKGKTAFNLSVLIFAFFHTGGIFQIIFAAIIGYFLTFIYRKYRDIRLSMMAHIIVNVTSILISPIILLLF